MSDDAITLIADALENGLIHPGTRGSGAIALPLPMFQNSHLPAEMREQFAKDAGLPHPNIAKLTAEALVHLLKNNSNALAETVANRATAQTQTPTAKPTPKTAPTKPRKPRNPNKPQPTPLGNMHVTINGETLMTDLGDWKRQPPEIIANAIKPGAQPPGWTKALLMALTDAAVANTPQRIDVTTSERGWTMSVDHAEAHDQKHH